MKKLRTTLPTALALFLSFGADAFAANGGRSDNSSLVVWMFLGFCALIVAAQLLPLIRTTRLVAQKKKEEQAEPGGAIPATVNVVEEKKRA